ncbi:MAG TPA: M28 family metallopeptidase [Bacteroidota bacterium]
MEFAAAKFREFGLDEAFIMPIRETVSGVAGGSVNTNTGIAVGVLHGATKRIIVLGGHIDSADPDIPGANDDGSGSATVIELARVLKERNNESTIVFALFGGEEHGLCGSRHFAKHFDRMDSVFLMLQIDMANGSEWLLPLVDAGDISSPEWLVRASYEELDKLGYSGLSFPTHFYSMLESVSDGGIGSDHEPFLEKNIPAIDFTTDVTEPIHTPQDNLENFKPEGLKRSGDLVYRLVERFDRGVPDEPTGQYYLLQLGPILLFIPPPVLTIFVAIAIGAAIYSLITMRKRRTIEESPAKVPGLKLFFLMIIIQTCVWFSENIVGLIKGQRFPWMSEPDGYFMLGLFAGIAGIWISLQIAPRLNLTKVAYRYALRSMVFLVLFLAVFALVSVKLAVYPAVAMLLLSVAFLLPNRYARLLVWVLSGHFMYRLIFSEGFLLFARALTQIPAEGGASFYLNIFYILFFSLWSFPFLLAFAALYHEPRDPMPWLRTFAKPAGGIVTGLVVVAWIFYLSAIPAYTQLWKQPIAVKQSVDLDKGKGILSVSSSDFLDGALVSVSGKDTLITGRETSARFENFDASQGEWIRVERSVESRGDSNTTFDIRLWIHARYRPYRLKVTYAGGSGIPTDVTTPLVWSPGTNSISFQWYSFPDTALFLPVSFTVTGSDSVKEYIEATFLEQPVEVLVNKEMSSVSSRTVVEKGGVLRGTR